MDPLILDLSSTPEVIINVTPEEESRRSAICQSCSHFTPSQYVMTEVINATTGQPETVPVYKFEDCDIDDVILVGFLPLKSSNCPLGKW